MIAQSCCRRCIDSRKHRQALSKLVCSFSECRAREQGPAGFKQLLREGDRAWRRGVFDQAAKDADLKGEVLHQLYRHYFISLRPWPNFDDWGIVHALEGLEGVLQLTTKQDRGMLREAVMDAVWSRAYVKQCMELRWGKLMQGGAASFMS